MVNFIAGAFISTAVFRILVQRSIDDVSPVHKFRNPRWR